MKINVDQLYTAAENLSAQYQNVRSIYPDVVNSRIAGHYSQVSGYEQTGNLHGRALREDPGSAQLVLAALSEEIDGMARSLAQTATSFETQDVITSRGLDTVDTGGGAGGSASQQVAGGQAAGGVPMFQTAIATVPAAAIELLKAQYTGTLHLDLYRAQSAWATVGNTLRKVSGNLRQAAGGLVADNEGAAIEAIASRLNTVAGNAETITANAMHFQNTLGQLNAFHSEVASHVSGTNLALKSMQTQGPAGIQAAQALERVMVAYYASINQAGLNGLLPGVGQLNQQMSARQEADLTAAFDDVGTGSRIAASGITAPAAMVEQLTDIARAYPSQVGALNDSTNALAQRFGIDLGRGVFDPASIATSTASHYAPPQALNPMAMAQGVAGATNGFLPTTTHAPMLAGMPLAGGHGRNVASTQGIFARPRMVGGQPGAGGVPGGSPLSSLAAPMGTPARFGSGAGIGAGGLGAGAGAAHQPDAEQSRGRSGVGGSPLGTGAVGSSAAGVSGAQHLRAAGGGMMPMGAGARGGSGAESKRGKVKAVTTAVEREKNLTDLLGQAPPVIPGVIGDWVREVPPEN